MMQPLLDAGYHVMNAFFVVNHANSNPYHQDRLNAADTFARMEGIKTGAYAHDARPALRTLINIGPLADRDDGTWARPMRYKIVDNGDVLYELSIDMRAVFMDANGAGSGMQSNVHHGRFGDGYTFSCDIVLAVPNGNRDMLAAPPLYCHDLLITRVFNLTQAMPDESRKHIHVAKLRKDRDDIAAAQERAKLYLQSPLAEHHCCRCGAPARASCTAAWDAGEIWCVATTVGNGRLCYECTLEWSRLDTRKRKHLKTARGSEAAFVSYVKCGVECAGCTPPPPTQFVAGVSRSSFTALDAAAQRTAGTGEPTADTASAATTGETPGATNAPYTPAGAHCWFCAGSFKQNRFGKPVRHFKVNPRGGFHVLCTPCNSMLARKRATMADRTSTCPDSCAECSPLEKKRGTTWGTVAEREQRNLSCSLKN